MTIYLSENIKKFRRDQNLTQENLADFLGVTFQSVSNWERGESYPDITMLPDIAAFFKISIDELMGANKAQDETEIKRLLEEHDNLTDEKLILKAITALREKYPSDFRIQLRWMCYLVFYDWDNLEENTAEIMSIYRNIQNNCTKDSIRICAKRYYIYLMDGLSKKDGSKVTFEDYEPVIKEMPLMRDGRENYTYCYKMHNHPDADEITMEALEEQICLFYCAFADYYLGDKFDLDYQTYALEKTVDFFKCIYNDGNYSRMWRYVIDIFGWLGQSYFKKDDKEKALQNLRRSAELAVQFDNLDRFTVLHSTLFEGKTFDKHSLGTTFIARSRVKEHLSQHYPLSDDFKNSAEFKEIISMLD